MMQSDVQTERAQPSVLDMFLRALVTLGFACAAAILVMLAFGVLGNWGVYLGFVAIGASPIGFFTLARQGTPVRILPLLLPFACMMVGALGILVSGWTLFYLH
ncbi:MAG: hypothetical protein L0H73_09085 [Nitrococcus sp.]|nr:hypothetical protein [Nitrococcus sp.]